MPTERKRIQNEGLDNLPTGKYSFRVDMYFQGTFIGSALVTQVWGQRTARLAALRGIATSIYPMSDKDKVLFTSRKHER